MIRYHARWVLPVAAPPVRNGTVVVDGERIAWVGARHDAPDGTDIELGDALLIPGLVNTHIHLDLAAFERAVAPRAFFPWVRTLVRGLDELANDAWRADSALWSVADQLAHGVTTIAHTGPGRESFDALRSLGARGISYLEVFGPDPAQCAASMDGLRARVLAARTAETALVRVGLSPHAPYSVSDDLYRAVAAYARAEALPVAVHIAESSDESELVGRGSGAFAEFLRGRGIPVGARARSPIALLEATGVLATRPLCIHAVRVDADDIQHIAQRGATVAHCPCSNGWLGHGDAPIAAMRAAGISVGLGTDSIASNDRVRMLAEASAAADAGLTSAARLDMLTRGGASALRIEGIGALVSGYQADLAAFRIRDTATCDRDAERYLLTDCATEPSILTVVAGAVRARNGQALALHDTVAPRVEGYRNVARRWSESSLA